MDLGLNFEDEDLQCDEKDKVGDRDLPYNVKICTDQWFEDALTLTPSSLHSDDNSNDVDVELRMKIEKFSADLHYHKKDYVTALGKYKTLSGMMSPKTNSAMWHDVQESLSRCYLHAGLIDQGLHIAREMVKAASTEDEARQRQALSLLSFACEKAQNWAECVETLEQLCELQPQFPQVWHKLGDICSQQGKGETSSIDFETLRVKQLSSYLRAKLLFQSVMGTASDFIKERNVSMIRQLTTKIDQIPISTSRKEFAFEFIQKEVENQATCLKDNSSSASSPTVKEPLEGCEKGIFFEKFCSWNFYCDR